MNVEYQPRNYFSNGRNLEWGKDLTSEQRNSMQKGEIFILLGENKLPYSEILMDSYNQVREKMISETKKEFPRKNQ